MYRLGILILFILGSGFIYWILKAEPWVASDPIRKYKAPSSTVTRTAYKEIRTIEGILINF